METLHPNEPLLTDRELILEMRSDIKNITEKLVQLELNGSYGAKLAASELSDHETRIRSLEHFRWAIPMNTFLSLSAVALTAVLNLVLRHNG